MKTSSLLALLFTAASTQAATITLDFAALIFSSEAVGVSGLQVGETIGGRYTFDLAATVGQDIGTNASTGDPGVLFEDFPFTGTLQYGTSTIAGTNSSATMPRALAVNAGSGGMGTNDLFVFTHSFVDAVPGAPISLYTTSLSFAGPIDSFSSFDPDEINDALTSLTFTGALFSISAHNTLTNTPQQIEANVIAYTATVVPEPSSIMMLTLSGFGVWRRKRLKRVSRTFV